MTFGEAMPGTQIFVNGDATGWITIDFLRGVTLLPLAQPVKDGSIHRTRLSLGTVFPVHTDRLTSTFLAVRSRPADGAAKPALSGSPQPARVKVPMWRSQTSNS